MHAKQEVESLSGASGSDEDEEAEAKRHRRRLAAADDDSAPLQPPSTAEDVSTPPPPLPGPHARKAAAAPFADATAQVPSKPKRAKRKAAKAAAAAAAADCSRAQPDAAAATQSPRQGGSAAAAGQAPSEQPFGDARRLLQQMGQTLGRGHLFMGLEESSQPATPPQPTAQHAAGPGLGVGEAVQGAAKGMLQHSEAAAAHQVPGVVSGEVGCLTAPATWPQLVLLRLLIVLWLVHASCHPCLPFLGQQVACFGTVLSSTCVLTAEMAADAVTITSHATGCLGCRMAAVPASSPLRALQGHERAWPSSRAPKARATTQTALPQDQRSRGLC